MKRLEIASPVLIVFLLAALSSPAPRAVAQTPAAKSAAPAEAKPARKVGDHLTFKVPAEVKPTGQYAEMVPDGEIKSVVYIGFDGVEPLPARWLNNPLVFLLDCRGLPVGRYRFAAVASAADGEQARADFALVIGNAPPTPVPPGPAPPGPTPPGPAPPVDGFAAAARKWLEAVPKAAYSKEKAEKIAGAYTTVGSQGSDPARNAGWNLETFRTKTKELNWTNLSAEDIAAWAGPFFKPLADEQARLFAERKLSTTDVKGIATLWLETGEAIRKAAY